MDLKKYIIEKSKELNIDIIGFTDCSPFIDLKDYLMERREKELETEFEEKNLRLRISPKEIFSECESIIAIGVSYNVDFDGMPDFKMRGKLSKSSWGIDYHMVLKRKIQLLIDEIKKIEDFKYMFFVDTGPLIDREIANRCSLGWYGKNCSIINDEYGSFIFIGYILTDLKIEKDCPISSQCGDCDLCLRYCPTGALEGPYKFNPKKCISYLTQTKDKIPYELRDKMGMKVYGCDTCQLVCPKNKEAKKGREKSFVPDITRGYIDIEEIFNMTNREFKEKYGSMAGSWRGKNILKRNCLIALGNMKDVNNIEFLEKVLKESSPMIREYAAWAILNTNINLGMNIVESLMEKEKDVYVKKEMDNLLNYFKNLKVSR